MPSELHYVALGDSLAFGAIAERGYVARYADYLRDDLGKPVTVQNLAVPGWQSADLLAAIQSDQGFRSAIQNANVITWDIGGNDLAHARQQYLDGTCGGTDNQDCLRAAVSNFSSNWDNIVSELLKLRSPQNTIYRTMNVYNPFVEADQASGDFTALQSYLQQVNAHIQQSATANGIPFANVQQGFNGADGTTAPTEFLAFDKFHPNDAGHAEIANELRALGYSPFD